MTERYETLRAAAFGERLPIEARSGLALLQRRGMWAWAQVAAAPSAQPSTARPSAPRSTTVGDQRTVVRLFAALAARIH